MIRLGLLLYFTNTIIFQNPCNELINFASPEFRFAVILNSLRVDYDLFLRKKKHDVISLVSPISAGCLM